MATLRYNYSANIVQEGVELLDIGDNVGSQVDKAVRGVVRVFKDEKYDREDLLGATKSLRWRLLTHPQPRDFNTPLARACADVIVEAQKALPGTGPIGYQALSEMTSAAVLPTHFDSPVGPVLLQSLQEVGPSNCVVIAANGSAAAGISQWLNHIGTKVMTPHELSTSETFFEQAYAVGPPRFFPPSVPTAPMAAALTYLTPSWFADKCLPPSVLAQYAEGTTPIKIRRHRVGVVEAATSLPGPEEPSEDDLLPLPVWKTGEGHRPTADDNVTAKRLLLAGSYAILLDDGERIRTLDPRKPRGERVGYIDVNDVIIGTYLLLRDGRTERQVIYDAAISHLSDTAPAIVRSQSQWKNALQSELVKRGPTRSIAELSRLGLNTLDRVQAWVDPTLVAPNNPEDFEILLRWLKQPVHQTVANAHALRRARAQVSADMASLLETAIDSEDFVDLHKDGVLRLSHTDGFRGVIASRVIAISPESEVVSRSAVRVLFKDRGARWLE